MLFLLTFSIQKNTAVPLSIDFLYYWNRIVQHLIHVGNTHSATKWLCGVKWINDLQVIGSLYLRKDFWDRHGANTGTRWKEMYGERLFWRPKYWFWREIIDFSPLFIRKGFGHFWYKGNVSFSLSNREISSKIYRLTLLHAQVSCETDIVRSQNLEIWAINHQ